MIVARRLQRSFADGLITGEVEDLWEPWMRHADRALEDDALLALIQNELAKRCKKSKTRGRPATPVDVILRMMLLTRISHRRVGTEGFDASAGSSRGFFDGSGKS